MKLSLTLLVSALGYAAANPFAPKVTKNTAKAAYAAKLMKGATPLRRLEENEQDVDLTSYSIKFEKCQFVKQYGSGQGGNNNNKNKNGAQTVLATRRFVIFRLCPDSSCSSCNYNYGEYIVDMDTYLEAALEYKQQVQEQYCETCNQCIEIAAQAAEAEANGEEAQENENANMCTNVDTSSCYTECQNIENMEANGYVDASQYVGCNKLEYQDENGNNFYAGAMCASSGTRMKIAVFTDENCEYYDESADIANYLKNGDGNSMQLSYHLLKQTFAESECIASCTKVNENNNADDQAAAEVSEVCENLYDAAGKCESAHGFANGFINYDNYDNQVRNEELVCEFISSLKAGHYDQTGEIVISGGRSTIMGGKTTTGGQKFALTFFILGSVGLAGYAAMLHSQLTKGAKADLSRQGGAMA